MTGTDACQTATPAAGRRPLIPVRASTATAWLAVALVALSGCVAQPREAFTEAQQAQAAVPGLPGVRSWADAPLHELAAAGIGPPPRPADGVIDYLALSGGGSGGAFGAGLLAGWTATGMRPEFDLVSGVSTGALIAPFAFLGSSCDPVLVELYTSGLAESLSRRRGLPGLLASNSLVDPTPLRRLIDDIARPELLAAIAREHEEGRRLLVITTNLDAQRPVVWDMGTLAASRHPGALRLFRDVLMASASIPAVFPPVPIAVAVGSDSFSELHADGGTTTQVFTLPEAFLASEAPLELPHGARANLYVVLNAALMPEFAVVENSTLGVAERAYSTLLKTHVRGSLLATQAAARRSGIDLRLASIDEVIPYDASNPFDTGYMRAVFDLGYRRATEGRLWDTDPFGSAAPLPGAR